MAEHVQQIVTLDGRVFGKMLVKSFAEYLFVDFAAYNRDETMRDLGLTVNGKLYAGNAFLYSEGDGTYRVEMRSTEFTPAAFAKLCVVLRLWAGKFAAENPKFIHAGLVYSAQDKIERAEMKLAELREQVREAETELANAHMGMSNVFNDTPKDH